MSLSPEAFARQLRALLPPGAAWASEIGSRLSGLLAGLAEEYARVDARGDTLIDEADPRAARELLADWERVRGLPNICVTIEQSEAQRRAAVVAQATALGGSAPAYFVAVALALGYVITITEFALHTVEDDVETPLLGEAWAYAWQVNAALNTVGESTVESGADDALAWWGNEALECVLRRLRPAHTTVIFAYS